MNKIKLAFFGAVLLIALGFAVVSIGNKKQSDCKAIVDFILTELNGAPVGKNQKWIADVEELKNWITSQRNIMASECAIAKEAKAIIKRLATSDDGRNR